MAKLGALLALSIAGLALSACERPRPTPLGTDTHFYGYISGGRRFGVSIGASRMAARAAMQGQGYDFAGTANCGRSGLKDELGCGPGEMFDIYDKHEGVGHKTVSLGVRGERITKIAWSFILIEVDT